MSVKEPEKLNTHTFQIFLTSVCAGKCHTVPANVFFNLPAPSPELSS